MRTSLSLSGQSIPASAAALRRLDAGLQRAGGRVEALPLGRSLLRLEHLHIGGGPYPAGRRVGEHRHAELQIEFVCAGAVRFRAGQAALELAPGQGCLLAPGARHAWEATAETVMIGCLIDSEPACLQALHRRLGEALHPLSDPAAAAALARGAALLLPAAPPPWQTERAAAHLTAWLAACLAGVEALVRGSDGPAAAAAPDRSAREAAICRRAVQFIGANLDQPLQADEIALHAGVSARHLNRLFRARRGETVGQALARLRLQAARRMLREDPDRPVKSVAYACGFSRPAYFSQRYRQAFGRAPSAERG